MIRYQIRAPAINRDLLWLVLEEADAFAPQQPMGELFNAALSFPALL
jgi:hypothetical protein